MGWGLLLAFAAAALTGGATVLQAIGVRRARHYDRVNPRLLLSALHMLPYVAGLVMLALAFGATMLALRTTGLSVVQALAAASIAGVAATSAMIFRLRLHWVEWTAVGAVCAGVVLLVITQLPSSAPHLPSVGAWATLIAAGAIAVGALHAHTLLNGVVVPSLLAGLAYGDAAVASRMISQLDGSASALLASPATYAVVISGLIGTLLYATALQRGSVTAVFGLSTVGQTVGPAITGWLLLGDSVHAGTFPVAATGFALAVAGALVLGRHAHPETGTPVNAPAVPIHAEATSAVPDAAAAPALAAVSPLAVATDAEGMIAPATTASGTARVLVLPAAPPRAGEPTVQIVNLGGGAVPELLPEPLRAAWWRASAIKTAIFAAVSAVTRALTQRRKAAGA